MALEGIWMGNWWFSGFLAVFTRFVEVGRVAYINYGPDFGKLCIIVDIIDGKRVLIDGPSTGVKRQQISVARLYLTDFVTPLERAAKTEAVAAAFKDASIENKWNETAWAKKLATRAKKASMTDFCRFKARAVKKN
ncbi:60S ribosomal protein L14-like protein [Blastocystis sp. subtype 4]|uniref:60S ribosomal protein L14-like protein n=1 Tax=Blastocystis sp. subtype 4 TaxID=944170 RepID=UPI0007115AED|nr:60S ribosomal protein L14-like protein [Blastocystis sp. subtype 4]KNB44017.1 60S ribosomal protein L14-like protein [Blastocystis sp. subtype 4]|eukprot:XP_014527460.1 60S ribosomal protein L14-like protein [Blastocystis sp. subtype 4]